MPEHEVSGQKKQEQAHQRKRVSTMDSQPMSQNLMAWDISSYLIGPTPFSPPIQRHAALLSNASPKQRFIITRQLQQTYGNKYVQRLLNSMFIKPKLTVGAADDPYEHEADRVAEQGMNMPTLEVTNPQVTSNQPIAQRQASEEEGELRTNPLISSITQPVQLKEPLEDEIQTKPLERRQSSSAKEKESIQTKSFIQRQSLKNEKEIKIRLTIQRQRPREAIEETKGGLHEVLQVLGMLLAHRNPGPDGWTTLASGKRWLLSAGSRASSLSDAQRDILAQSPNAIESFFDIASVTWENVNPWQRTVFGVLDAAHRDKVRKAALVKSPLFKAITEMHVPATTVGGDLETKRKSVTSYRLREPGATPPNPTYGVPDSAAATLTESSTSRKAIVDPVREAMGNLDRFSNRGLAEWVHYRPNDELVVNKLHTLACGMTNLYALALARGIARVSKPGFPPTPDDTVAWLRRWTLDAPPDTALVTGSKKSGPRYNPTVILKAVSQVGQVLTPQGAFERPRGASAASKEFNIFMQRGARFAGQNKTRETRLGLIQGKSKTHSFLVYKDIDSVWRTMDVYLGLEDLPGELLGFPRHSRKVTAVYFIIDATPAG